MLGTLGGGGGEYRRAGCAGVHTYDGILHPPFSFEVFLTLTSDKTLVKFQEVGNR